MPYQNGHNDQGPGGHNNKGKYAMPKSEISPKGVSKEDAQIGARIRLERMNRGMSQTELGKRLRPPVTFQQVQKYEKGVNRLTAVRAQQMARIFEIPLDTLMPPLDGSAAVNAFDYLQEIDAVRLLQAYRRLERGPLRDAVRRLVELITSKDERALEGV